MTSGIFGMRIKRRQKVLLTDQLSPTGWGSVSMAAMPVKVDCFQEQSAQLKIGGELSLVWRSSISAWHCFSKIPTIEQLSHLRAHCHSKDDAHQRSLDPNAPVTLRTSTYSQDLVLAST